MVVRSVSGGPECPPAATEHTVPEAERQQPAAVDGDGKAAPMRETVVQGPLQGLCY